MLLQHAIQPQRLVLRWRPSGEGHTALIDRLKLLRRIRAMFSCVYRALLYQPKLIQPVLTTLATPRPLQMTPFSRSLDVPSLQTSLRTLFGPRIAAATVTGSKPSRDKGGRPPASDKSATLFLMVKAVHARLTQNDAELVSDQLSTSDGRSLKITAKTMRNRGCFAKLVPSHVAVVADTVTKLEAVTWDTVGDELHEDRELHLDLLSRVAAALEADDPYFRAVDLACAAVVVLDLTPRKITQNKAKTKKRGQSEHSTEEDSDADRDQPAAKKCGGVGGRRPRTIAQEIAAYPQSASPSRRSRDGFDGSHSGNEPSRGYETRYPVPMPSPLGICPPAMASAQLPHAAPAAAPGLINVHVNNTINMNSDNNNTRKVSDNNTNNTKTGAQTAATNALDIDDFDMDLAALSWLVDSFILELEGALDSKIPSDLRLSGLPSFMPPAAAAAATTTNNNNGGTGAGAGTGGACPSPLTALPSPTTTLPQLHTQQSEGGEEQAASLTTVAAAAAAAAATTTTTTTTTTKNASGPAVPALDEPSLSLKDLGQVQSFRSNVEGLLAEVMQAITEVDNATEIPPATVTAAAVYASQKSMLGVDSFNATNHNTDDFNNVFGKK